MLVVEVVTCLATTSEATNFRRSALSVKSELEEASSVGLAENIAWRLKKADFII